MFLLSLVKRAHKTIKKKKKKASPGGGFVTFEPLASSRLNSTDPIHDERLLPN